MGVALKDLRGKVKRPIRSVTVCLDGDLWSRHDELAARLDEVRAKAPAAKMSEATDAREVAEELREVEAAMREASVAVQFRGVSSYQLKEIQRRFPAEDKRQEWDVSAGAHALIAACAVEPTTEEEAKELLGEVNFAVADKLFTAAWVATTGSSEVPTSARASALISASAPR